MGDVLKEFGIDLGDSPAPASAPSSQPQASEEILPGSVMPPKELGPEMFTVDEMAKETAKPTKKKSSKEMREMSGPTQTEINRARKQMEDAAKAQAKEADKAKKDFEDVQKRKLTEKINRYFHAFPDLLDNIPKLKATASLAETQETLRLIKEEIESMWSMHTLKRYTAMVFSMVEMTVGDGKHLTWIPENLGRPNLVGLTNAMNEPAIQLQIECLLKEIDAEYPIRHSLPIRILNTFGDICHMVHKRNTVLNPLALEKPVATEIPH